MNQASLTDNARVVIYDRHMFVVQATELALVYTGTDSNGPFCG
jgi:hypothetical protein